MSHDYAPSALPHLMWVYNASPSAALAATSKLEVTRELRKLCWRVTLVAEGPAGQQSFRGVEVLCIPKPQVYFLGYCVFHLRVLRLLAREWTTIDVILSHEMSTPWLLPLRLVRRLTGRQRPLIVMDTRDTNPVGGNLRNRLRNVFYSLSHGMANRWADGQTATAKRMPDLVGIPPQQLWCIWTSGVNPDRFAPARGARRWPLAGEPVHLIYVGVMHHDRNLISLCRAVEAAKAEGMEFVLSLIGDGAARVELEKFALQTAGRIRVIPPVPHEEIPGWMAKAHVGVTSLPSPDERKYQATSPIKLFEYMAAGLPILATCNFCHTDVVGSGDFAFWAEDASVEGLLTALRLVWGARASLSRMGREAAAASQAWTWQESARKLSVALERGLRDE